MPTGQEDDPSEFWTSIIQLRIASTQGVSHRDKPEVIESARRKIDKEMAAMYAVISSVLTRRNALSPISSLPTEVLARILHFHATNEPLPPQNTSDPLGWIRATHVCRFWRETALQDPCLWSEVTDTLGGKWTEEMLARAKSAPISYTQLSYMGGTSGNVVASRVMPHQLFRLHHLSITDHTNTMAAIIQSMTDSPAPILETLQLLHQGKNEGPVLLPEPFASHSPTLHQLELLRVHIPWSSSIFCGLHHLIIKLLWSEAIPGNVPFPDYYNQFYTALEKMPDLRTLCLENCLPARPRPVAAEYSISLLCLESLSLYSEDTSQCVGVLMNVTIPQSCRVVVDCDDFSPSHFGEIRDLVKAHTDTNTYHPPPLTIFLSISDDDRPVYIVNFWRTARSTRPVDICAEPDFSLRVSRADADNLFLFMTRLTVLVRNLWIESICTLIIDGDDIFWTALEWVKMFQPYTALETVSVNGRTAVTFCDALRMPMDKARIDQSGNEDSVKNVFLSKLKLVELRTVYFDLRYYDEEDNYFHEQLKTWLALRQKAGGMLPTFAIKGCSVCSDQVEELEEIIEVDWDLVEDF